MGPEPVPVSIDRTDDTVLGSDPEACYLSANVRKRLRVSIGTQIRLRCEDDVTHESGLFTVADDLNTPTTVEVGTDGLDRLGFDPGTMGTVSGYAPHPTYETRTAAAKHDEFVELLTDRGQRDLVVCAPHGGWIEYKTDRQAARVGDQLAVTEWSCVGYNSGGGAFDRWHITSTAIDRRSFPKLDLIADSDVTHAVSFHGASGDAIMVGGRASGSLRRAIRDAIDVATDGRYDVELAPEEYPYSGTSSENFVNWLAADGGVQLHQSWDARINDWATIADAVSTVYADRL